MTIAAIIAGRGTVHTAGPDETLAEVARRLTDLRIGAVPVVNGEQVIGILSERDILHCVARRGADVMSTRVADAMTAPVISIEPDAAVLSALTLMTHRRIRHLPVMDGGQLVAFVSIGDLVKYRIERIEAEAAAMRDYITGA
jgi:CBS domain-containing protein